MLNMKQEIQRLLYKGGVFQSYRGYAYFEQAVLIAYENPESLLYMCKEIYTPIAVKFNSTVSTVEKDIRTVRDVFMRNGGEKILKEMGFDIFNSHPYPREMIEIFASYFLLYKNIPK